jgi:hypothetical protein
MKIIIKNKVDLEFVLDDIKESGYKNSSKIHKELYNIVNNNYSTENKIEVMILIPYAYDRDGDCIFQFVGMNKDLFFYEYQGTVK